MNDTDTDPRICSAARIAAQNDAFRRHFCLGEPWPQDVPVLEGRLVATAAVSGQGPLFVQTCLRTTGLAADFSEENNPEGHNDFGAFEIVGKKVWWKIDCYDRDYHFGSDDPADPDMTARVLTILFPSDW